MISRGSSVLQPSARIPLLTTFGITLIAACGGSGGSTKVTWTGSANGSTVLDGNGNTFYFDSANGCLDSTVSNSGPIGFCLTNPAGGTTGPTNCPNPATNSLCDAASFEVTLASPTSGTGCVAVLSTPVVTSYFSGVGQHRDVTQLQPLDITMSVATSSVQTVKRFPTPNGISTPTAYATYWNGAVAACGGTSSYAGSYTFQTAMSCSNFGAVSNASLVFSEPATIDSTGAITDDGTYRVWGSISSGGTGSFTASPSYMSGTITEFSAYTIGSATRQANGKWVIEGTTSPATMPVDCGTLTATFTLTQD